MKRIIANQRLTGSRSPLRAVEIIGQFAADLVSRRTIEHERCARAAHAMPRAFNMTWRAWVIERETIRAVLEG